MYACFCKLYKQLAASNIWVGVKSMGMQRLRVHCLRALCIQRSRSRYQSSAMRFPFRDQNSHCACVWDRAIWSRGVPANGALSLIQSSTHTQNKCTLPKILYDQLLNYIRKIIHTHRNKFSEYIKHFSPKSYVVNKQTSLQKDKANAQDDYEYCPCCKRPFLQAIAEFQNKEVGGPPLPVEKMTWNTQWYCRMYILTLIMGIDVLVRVPEYNFQTATCKQRTLSYCRAPLST